MRGYASFDRQKWVKKQQQPMEGQRYQHPILHRHHIISKTDRVKKLRVKDRPSFLGSIIIVSQRRKETNSFYCTTSLSLWTHILSRTLKHLHFYFFLRAWQRIPAPPFFFSGHHPSGGHEIQVTRSSARAGIQWNWASALFASNNGAEGTFQRL